MYMTLYDYVYVYVYTPTPAYIYKYRVSIHFTPPDPTLQCMENHACPPLHHGLGQVGLMRVSPVNR